MNTKNYQIVLNQQKKRIKEVQDALNELYFITQKESLNILNKLEFMPPEAFQDVLSLLKEAKKEQDKALKKMIQKDPDFNKKLKEGLKNKYQDIVEEFSSQEVVDAEHILDQLIE